MLFRQRGGCYICVGLCILLVLDREACEAGASGRAKMYDSRAFFRIYHNLSYFTNQSHGSGDIF